MEVPMEMLLDVITRVGGWGQGGGLQPPSWVNTHFIRESFSIRHYGSVWSSKFVASFNVLNWSYQHIFMHSLGKWKLLSKHS